MVGPERRAPALAAGLVLAAALTGACAQTSQTAPREPLPPRAVEPLPPEPQPPAEPPVATPPPKPTTVIVVEPGGDADQPQTLADAAARERERRRTADKPIAVIDNKNLAEYARGQKLTIAEPANEEPAAEPAPAADGHDEAWWRERGLEIRRRWRDAVDAVPELKGEVADLRRRFYDADDPYQRDAQIKPQWDKAIADLEDARQRAAAGREEVEAFLEEGRRAGALPGWLREGVELEPEPVLEEQPAAEPVEPVELDDEPLTP